jgi:streptogramin lyase
MLGAGLLSACDGTGGSTGSGASTGTQATGGTATATGGSVLAVTTVAGLGPNSDGFVNGVAGVAQFDQPAGLAMDSAGNLYVADSLNNAIRKIDTQGNVTTVAGLGFGSMGLRNGGVKTAEFNNPLGVAVDSSGNLFVADNANSAIRKIDTHGNVTTFVGPEGTTWVSSGEGAGVNYPTGIAIDSSGNLYVADGDDNAIRKIDPSANVSTIAGGPGHLGFSDGDAGTAKFQPPYGIAVDTAGNVYFTDQIDNAVRKVDTQGNVSTLAGLGSAKHGFVDGSAATAQLFEPCNLAPDTAGNLYFTDQRNNAVRKIDPQGNVSTIVGRGPASDGFVNGDAGTAEFNYPSGVVLDSSGNLYVGDLMNNAVRKITAP